MEVEEVWAGECVVFISHNLVVTESAEAVLSGDIGVSTEFDVEAVVGASKTECLWSEVVGAVIQVGGGVERWMEEAERVEFRTV